MKFAERYEAWARKKGALSSTLLLSLPHTVQCTVLALIFQKHLVAIFFVGMFLPDYAMYEYLVLKSLGFKEAIKEELMRKKIAHYITFFLSAFLLAAGYWDIALAGFTHFVLDYIGF